MRSDRSRLLVVVGPVVAVALAAALVPVRGGVANANVALALAMVVVAVAALGGRVPAAVTSLAAATAFNVLHTRPYLSLKIDSRADMISTALLLVMGLVAGLVTERGWRHRERAVLRVAQLDRICRIAELAVAADDLTAVWPTVRDTLCQELHLGSCWFEPDAPDGSEGGRGVQFPELTHRGTIDPSRAPFRVSPGGGYELPPNGVELALTGGGTWHRPADQARAVINGMLTILIDPARLGTQASLAQEAQAFVDWLRQSPPAPGSDGVQVAGEPERAARRQRLQAGIQIDDQTWAEIGQAHERARHRQN